MRIATHWPLLSAPERALCGADGGRFLEPGTMPPRGYCRPCARRLANAAGLWNLYRSRGYHVPAVYASDVRAWDSLDAPGSIRSFTRSDLIATLRGGE